MLVLSLPMKKPAIIGHRGARSLAPENTVSAIEKALEFGASYVELDVRITKDDILVILHDEKLNRMTNGAGFLSQTEYSELSELKVKRKEAVPKLADILETFGGKCGIILDIKTRKAMIPAYKVVKKADMLDRVIFTSKDGIAVAQLKDKEKARTGYSCDDRKANIMQVAKILGTCAIFPEYKLVSQELVDKAHENDMEVFVWTINCPIKMKKLALLDVDGIITDRPDKLQKVLTELDGN